MDTTVDLRPNQVAIVIGVDHKIQHFIDDIALNDRRIVLRLRFRNFLREITGSNPVDLICEEAKHGAESIAETMADREHLRYRNIEMSPQRRAELGIPPLYTVDPQSEITPEQKAKWNALRESHMVDELLGVVGGARVLIVICGVSHMPLLAQALQSKFRRVEQHDVTAESWFDTSLL
jgi:hypothetical protein